MIRKRYNLNWMFECPDAVLTCSILRCRGKKFLVFGGHDKTLYLMDEEMNIVDDRSFDGWCRCSFPIDLDGDGCDEVLVGAGDGNFMVMKLNPEKKKLVGLMRYKSTMRVNCCIAGDLTRDGNIELIFGSEDKTIKIFDSIDAKKPKFVLYYDSWVTASTLGFLKLPDEKVTVYGLLVGTKNGLLQLVRIINDMPDIIWQRNFFSQINDIKVGDVTNDGFNEIIISTDDSTIIILNSEGEPVKEIETDEGRPIALLIEDIDGDNAKEIVAGCSDGSLKVFHNPELDSTDIELKWKTKVSTSIKHICTTLGKESQKHIIFGGYDHTIRNVNDFEWGQKQTLNIPQKVLIPEIKKSKEKKSIEEEVKLEEVPTNISEYIFKILKDKGYMKDLIKELKGLGYSNDEIFEELERIRTQKSIIYEKVTYPVWSAPAEEIEAKVEIGPPIEEPKVSVKHMVIEEQVKTGKEKLREAFASEIEETERVDKDAPGKSLTNVIIDYLKQNEIVATKSKFINDIKEKGFPTNIIEKEINNLKEQGKIQYSRTKPKGWSLVD